MRATCYDKVVLQFDPFPGIRYDTDRVALADVTAPPYDVIDADQRDALAARSPYNVVAIDCPIASDETDRYEEAAARFGSWQADGILRVDEEPSFYLYRMTFRDETGTPHETTGVIGALGLESQEVLPHEHTTPKAKSDRLALMRATHANLSPVWALSLAEGLSSLLEPSHGEAIGQWQDDDGVRHQLWRLGDTDLLRRIGGTVTGAPVVIADGHHRFETSINYRNERGASGSGSPSPYDLTMALIVELAEDQLTVGPIHRLVSGLAGDGTLLDVLRASFSPVETVPIDIAPNVLQAGMAATNSIGLVEHDAVHLLHPRTDAFVGVPEVDSGRLDAALASIDSHTLTFQHSAATVLQAVRERKAQAGVLLRPPTVAQIAATARAGGRMPPKTTFFWPKPRTGTVFRTVA